jgi:hypothetical protein
MMNGFAIGCTLTGQMGSREFCFFHLRSKCAKTFTVFSSDVLKRLQNYNKLKNKIKGPQAIPVKKKDNDQISSDKMYHDKITGVGEYKNLS